MLMINVIDAIEEMHPVIDRTMTSDLICALLRAIIVLLLQE